MMDTFENEKRLRRIAARRGFELKVHRTPDGRRWSVHRSGVMASDLTLDEVDQYLSTDRR
jgi:hypothetical protein